MKTDVFWYKFQWSISQFYEQLMTHISAPLGFDELRWRMTSMSIAPAFMYATSTWRFVPWSSSLENIRDQNLEITVPPDVVVHHGAAILTFTMQTIKLDVTFPFALLLFEWVNTFLLLIKRLYFSDSRRDFKKYCGALGVKRYSTTQRTNWKFPLGVHTF